MKAKTITSLKTAALPEDIAFYDSKGWYLSDIVIDDDTIQQCLAAAEEIYEGRYEREQPWSHSPLIQNFGVRYDRMRLRVDQFPSFHSDRIRLIVTSRQIAAVAAGLLKTRRIRYYKDILIGTPSQTSFSDSSIPWHTDESYWRTCIPECMTTVYVPLQDRDEESGTLLMISGSHQWANKTFNLSVNFNEVDKIAEKYEREGRKVELHPLVHKKGQVSFHSSRVIHATYPNVTETFQHSIVFGLQAEENCFVPSPIKRLNKAVVVNLNDEIGPKLSDGTPDIKNDDFYPVLFDADVDL